MTKIDNKRVQLMGDSLSDFESWLLDIVHKGLAQLDNYSSPFHLFWQQSSSQLVDGKNSSTAALVKEIPQIMGQKSDWTSDVLLKLGDIYLIIKAFEGFQYYEENIQYELLTSAGWSITSAKVKEYDQKITDIWQVIGKVEGKQDDLRYRRLWLLGKTSSLPVLVLEYAFGNSNFATNYELGREWEADVYFFPGNGGLRGIITNSSENNNNFITTFDGLSSFEAFLENYLAAISVSPWLRQYPCCLCNLMPTIVDNQPYFIDKDQNLIPVFYHDETTWWKIMALSGNKPINVFGEWNGKVLEVLSVLTEGDFASFYVYHRH